MGALGGEESSSSKTTKKQRAVRFSNTSTLHSYYDKYTPSEKVATFYSVQDYNRFSEEATRLSCKIRISLIMHSKSSDSNSNSSGTTKKISASKQYIESFKLPRQLLHSDKCPTSQEEIIGIEHLLIGDAMTHVNIALRQNSSSLLLNEQRRQQDQQRQEMKLHQLRKRVQHLQQGQGGGAGGSKRSSIATQSNTDCTFSTNTTDPQVELLAKTLQPFSNVRRSRANHVAKMNGNGSGNGSGNSKKNMIAARAG